ncbi:MAG: hypothetical protein E8D52_07670 [Nitrospira sp.]|nr:MAG: hypothetical protein E8D52_07670 [Nitrospira sp.]
MTTPGLLVEDYNGQDYLLTTESRAGVNTHRLVVLQRVNRQWKHLNGVQESACREVLIGAFVDFFVDICRVLNASGSDRTVRIAARLGRSRARRASLRKPLKAV